MTTHKQVTLNKPNSFADSLPAACMVIAVGILVVVAWQVSDALRMAHRVHLRQEATVAHLVAEQSAFAFTAKLEANGDSVETVSTTELFENPSGMRAEIEIVPGKLEPYLQIYVSTPAGRRYPFRCDLLPGAAPRSLGNPLSIRHASVTNRPGLQSWLRRHLDVHVNPMGDGDTVADLLDSSVQEVRISLAASHLIKDRSIALLRLPSGTDRVDYRFEADESGVVRAEVPVSGVIHVSGNLWIDRGDRALVVEVDRPLTIVVEGNVYLGRSLAVRGSGRLIIVVRRSGRPTFRDLDQNGAWSPGDRDSDATPNEYTGEVEGAGMVYLGLPGDANRPRAARLQVEASLVAAGEVYALATEVLMDGALVLGEGLTFAERTELELSGERLPNNQRERLPGFGRVGALRPGILTAGW